MYSEERSGRFGPGMTASSAAAGLISGSALYPRFLFTNSQFTSLKKVSTNLARSFR